MQISFLSIYLSINELIISALIGDCKTFEKRTKEKEGTVKYTV